MMRTSEKPQSGSTRPGSPTSLADADIRSVRVDRRSFFSRAIAAGSVAAAAALTAACPGGSDSDGGGDSGGGSQ